MAEGTSNSKINEDIHNAIVEIGNIGSGNAGTSLAFLLGARLTMSVPEVKYVSFDELELLLGGADKTIIGVLSMIDGDISSMMLFAIGIDEANHLVQVLLKDKNIEWHNELAISAIKEIANILIGSYVSSIETLTNKKMRTTTPEVCVDMAAAILSVPCIELGKVSDNALIIDSHFKIDELAIRGHLIMVSETDIFNDLLKKFGVGGLDV